MSTKSLFMCANPQISSPTTTTTSCFVPQIQPKLLPFPHKRLTFPLRKRTQFLKCQQEPNPNTNPNNGNHPSLPTTPPHHHHHSAAAAAEEDDDDEEECQLRDTREAVSQFLQELGVSKEESQSTSLNSPKYAKMLVDSVRDLDEWNAWKSESNGGEGEGFGILGFKEKVIYMAKKKGDSGKVAFLESIGFGLASAMNVARYLSREPLPVLIHKVKYMKEMFFSGSDDKGIIAKNARRMLMHLSIAIDDDLQQTLSFFEKVEARRGGLNTLGSPNVAFQYLVESFPLILLLPIESRLQPMVEFLESIEVPKERMAHIFLLFPPIILYDIRAVKRKVLAFEKIGAAGRDLGKMLLKYPWICSTCIQDNYNEILLLFNTEKVPKVFIDRAIRSWPHILGCATSKLKVMVEQLAELGVKNEKLGHVVAASPQLLLKKPQEFLQVVSFLDDLGFDQQTVGNIVGRCPEIFVASIQKTLKKKVEFLRYIGVSEEYLPRAIKKYPELLVSNVDRTLLPRMNYLLELGISRKDVAFMVGSFSPLLGYSIDEVLRPKYEFLVNIMEKPVKDVVLYPRYFSYSLERRIKPRFLFLKGSNIECSLKEMLSKNDEEFAAMFMDPGKMPRPSSPSHQ